MSSDAPYRCTGCAAQVPRGPARAGGLRCPACGGALVAWAAPADARHGRAPRAPGYRGTPPRLECAPAPSAEERAANGDPPSTHAGAGPGVPTPEADANPRAGAGEHAVPLGVRLFGELAERYVAPGVPAGPGEWSGPAGPSDAQRGEDPDPKVLAAGSGTTPNTEPAAQHADRPVVVEIAPPPLNSKDSAVIDQFVGTLSGLKQAAAFEIAGTAGDRKLLVRGSAADVAYVTRQLYEIYGQVEVRRLPPEHDPAERLAQGRGHTVALTLTTARPDFLALKTWREFEAQEPLLPLLGAFAGLGPDETALSQIVIAGPAPRDWARAHLQQVAALERRGYGTEAPPVTNAGAARATGALLLLLCAAGLGFWAVAQGGWIAAAGLLAVVAIAAGAIALFVSARNPWSEAQVAEAAAKLRDDAFQVELRLWGQAATPAAARAIVERLQAAYQVFNTTSGNRLDRVEPLTETDPARLVPERRKPRYAILARGEVAGMWHMPVLEALSQVRRNMYERILPRPADVQEPGGRLIGRSRRGEEAIDVYLSPLAVQRNLLVCGRSQHGKSRLQENIALGWMEAGEAVVVLDPHGDLARRLIGRVPAGRIDDVIYINLADKTRSIGLNLLDTQDGDDPNQLVQRVADIGKALWKEYWGPRMRVPITHALRALAHANLTRAPERQYGIFSVPALLTCRNEAREDFLETEVPRSVLNTHLYFLDEYQHLTPGFRQEVISPVLSKIDAFGADAAIWRLLGQPRSTVNLEQALRSRKIVIVNLSAGELGDDLADFLGSFILNLVRRVIMGQAQLERAERLQIGVLVDEFHALTGVDHGRLAGDLLKFGGHFVFGTQATANLLSVESGRKTLESVLAGVSTVVALNCIGVDAAYFAENELDMGRLQPESLANLPPGHAYIKSVKASGERLPVFSVELVLGDEPDPQVAQRIQDGQIRYTVPADEADRLYRASLEMFYEHVEHVVRPTERSPQGVAVDVARAAERLQPERAEPVSDLALTGRRDDFLVSPQMVATAQATALSGDPAVSADAQGFGTVARQKLVVGPAPRKRAARTGATAEAPHAAAETPGA